VGKGEGGLDLDNFVQGPQVPSYDTVSEHKGTRSVSDLSASFPAVTARWATSPKPADHYTPDASPVRSSNSQCCSTVNRDSLFDFSSSLSPTSFVLTTGTRKFHTKLANKLLLILPPNSQRE